MKFRVNPWQMLLLILLFRGSASVFSVFFRVRPWQVLLLVLLSVAMLLLSCNLMPILDISEIL